MANSLPQFDENGNLIEQNPLYNNMQNAPTPAPVSTAIPSKLPGEGNGGGDTEGIPPVIGQPNKPVNTDIPQPDSLQNNFGNARFRNMKPLEITQGTPFSSKPFLDLYKQKTQLINDQVNPIIKENLETYQPNKDAAKAAMQNALQAQMFARMSDTLGATADAQTKTPFGKGDTSAIRKNTLGMASDINADSQMQNQLADQQLKTAQTGQQMLQSNEATAQEALKNQLLAKGAGMQLTQQSLQNKLTGAQISATLAQGGISPADKLQAAAEQKFLDKYQAEMKGTLKKKSNLDSMAATVKDHVDPNTGELDIHNMSTNARTNFATEVARTMVDGKLTNYEEQKAFGQLGLGDAIRGAIQSGNPAQHDAAVAAIKAKLEGQGVSDSQIKELYHLYQGQRQALGQQIQDLNHRYATEGSYMTGHAYEPLKGMLDKIGNVDRFQAPNKQQSVQPMQSGTPKPSNVKVFTGWDAYDKQGKVE
jgi:hypothetical protein